MTTVNKDIISLSLTETLPHTNPELQLCLQDLVHPSETAEDLLISLSTEQLTIIERILSKIKRRKLNTPSTTESLNIANDIKPQVNNITPLNNTVQNTPISIPTNTTLTTTTTDTPPNAVSMETAKPPMSPHPSLSQEPTTEVKEGVEWVSFVYSHHRALRKYCIRTDLEQVDINLLDEKFKKENCVYPRANLPQETYRGNRWSYETECNVLGWKLAWLNLDEIAGKRGLIQRAVDSYRNRYPSMRSRRVARQEKLLKGTLRKRKQREPEEKPASIPKTILIDDLTNSTKCRIRINIESVLLDAVDIAFRKNNCVFPRSIHITPDTPSVSQRRMEEAKCNEIGWKLAWLNPRQLSNKKNLLQRALDIFRQQFAPDLKPRKYAPRVPLTPLALTEETLANQQKELGPTNRRNSSVSCYSGTTVTLDFHDYCFSPPPEDVEQQQQETSSLLNEIVPSVLQNVKYDSHSSTTSASSNDENSSPSPQALLAFYQQAALLITDDESELKESDLFQPSSSSQNMLDFVNAGMTTTDPTLLNQYDHVL